MKRFITILIVLSFSGLAFAQNDDSKPKDRPVRSAFQSGLLIDNQTTVVPAVKTLEYVIQHKFGNMDNGFSDLFGVYAPGANIRMGMNYTIMDKLQIGYGLTRLNMYSDFSVKYSIVEQTRKNTIPVAVAIYANMAIDGRDESVFGNGYEFTDRMSYFAQLIVGRKVNDWLSVQFNTSFAHYNKVDSLIDHDVISIGINGRAQFSPQSAILFQYDVPLKIKGISEHIGFANPSKPNFGIGWEIATSTHAFHIYIATADGIVPQHNAFYNKNDFTKGDMMLGFTITRLWNF